MKRTRRNDEERRQWVLNDEGLYSWSRTSRLSLREFIREHRTAIDECIDRALGVLPLQLEEQIHALNFGASSLARRVLK